MRNLLILLVHLIAILARLMGPGGARSLVAESLLVKQQLLILNRSRQRAPNLRASDRILAGVCALFMRPARVIRSAIVLKPSTILDFHRILRKRKYRLLFSPKCRGRTGPKGPSKALVDAIVEMKRRNPVWGCPRIVQQIGLTFDLQIDKDVVRRVLATHYRPNPDSSPVVNRACRGSVIPILLNLTIPPGLTVLGSAGGSPAPPPIAADTRLTIPDGITGSFSDTHPGPRPTRGERTPGQDPSPPAHTPSRAWQSLHRHPIAAVRQRSDRKTPIR